MRSLKRLFRLLLTVQGVFVVGAQIFEDLDEVEILVRRRKDAQPRCPECHKALRGKIISHRVRWRHWDILDWKCYLAGEVREGWCPRHGRRVEQVPWATPAARHTKAFDRKVARMVQMADKTAVTELYRVSWRTVGRIVRRVVDAELPKDLYKDLDAIGVDEVSFKRGHRYLTVVSDLVTSRVIWLGEGNSAETLTKFFQELGKERAHQLSVVAMDMSEAYRTVVAEWAPQAQIVYDRFHVVKLLLDAVDELRREECRKVQGPAREALKKTRFALLRNPKHRTPRDLEAIQRVEKGNRRLARGYGLRVDFEELWMIENEADARVFLMRWTRAALRSRLSPLRRFANTVREHLDGILGFFRYYGTTNAVLEGTNNKIKLLIHRAYGFRSVPALLAMIHLCCSGINLS